MSNSATAEQREEEINTFRELREYSRGSLDVDHHDVHPIAGLIEDHEIREVLMFMAENYDPTDADGKHIEGLPYDFWETEFAKRAVRKYATHKATEAIEEGNLTQASYFSGIPSYKSDVSGLHAINQLADWLVHSEQCKLIYLAALMGRGKTDLSLTFLQVIHDHFDRLQRSVGSDVHVPEPEFAANFHATAEPDDVTIHEMHHFEELIEWGKQGGSDDVRWFIFDEASTELTAQSGSNAQDVAETMAPFVKKMRKMGINMIVIGHDKGDVHPAIRSLADFVDKMGLKTASFYAGINNREPQGHLFDLDGIPPTSWEFNTDDVAEWCWCEDHSAASAEVEQAGMTDDEFKTEIAERAARIWATTDISQEDLAQAISTEDVGVSPTTISRYAGRMGLKDNPDSARAT